MKIIRSIIKFLVLCAVAYVLFPIAQSNAEKIETEKLFSIGITLRNFVTINGSDGLYVIDGEANIIYDTFDGEECYVGSDFDKSEYVDWLEVPTRTFTISQSSRNTTYLNERITLDYISREVIRSPKSLNIQSKECLLSIEVSGLGNLDSITYLYDEPTEMIYGFAIASYKLDSTYLIQLMQQDHIVTIFAVMNNGILSFTLNNDYVILEGADSFAAFVSIAPVSRYDIDKWRDREAIDFVCTATLKKAVRIYYNGEADLGYETEDTISREYIQKMLDKSNELLVDVPEDAWYKKAVYSLYRDRIMRPLVKNAFLPNEPARRDAIITALYNTLGRPSVSNTLHGFSDVPIAFQLTDEDAITWAYGNGIVYGVGNNLFSPDGKITRQDLAAILYRYELKTGKIPQDVSPGVLFADNDKIAGYAKAAVYALARQGIIKGRDNNLFDPAAPATRAEVAAMLYRLMGNII